MFLPEIVRTSPQRSVLVPFVDDLLHFLTVKQAAYTLGGNETRESVGRIIRRRLLRATRLGRAAFKFMVSVCEGRFAPWLRSAA